MKRVRLLSNGKVDRRQFNGGNPAPSTGRPVGSKNKFPIGHRSEVAAAHIASGGIMPLDFMLSVLRLNEITVGAEKGKSKKHIITFEDKKWAADRLLHCFTPKLTSSTVQVKAPVLTLPPEALKDLNEEELTVLEKVFGNMAKDITPMNGNGNGSVINAVSAAAYVEELNGEDEE